MSDLEQVATVTAGFVLMQVVGYLGCLGALEVLERGAARAGRNEAPPLQPAPAADPRPLGYPGAGTMIGVLERAIAFGCVLGGAPAGIALLLVVKTAARFGEAKDDHRFAERFIVGTFVSIGAAGLGAALVRHYLDLEPILPG